MNLSLDTNAYSKLCLQHKDLVSCIDEAEKIFVSTVVLGELFTGLSLGRREKENREELMLFLDLPGVEVVPITTAIADRYASIMKTLRKQGTPIPTNDIWIAASAFETGSRLVSYDSHFGNIPGLIIVAP